MLSRSSASQAVERERIAGRRVRVRPHDDVDVVPARRQRMARLHRLDAVGALERKPDVGEVEDAQRADVTGDPAAAARSRFVERRPVQSGSGTQLRRHRAAASRTRRTHSGRARAAGDPSAACRTRAISARFHQTQSAIAALTAMRRRPPRAAASRSAAEADDEDHRDRDEPPLPEGARHRPRFDAPPT